MVLIRMLPVLDRLTFTITSVSAAKQAAAHGPGRVDSTVWVVMAHQQDSIPTCLRMHSATAEGPSHNPKAETLQAALVQGITVAPKLHRGNTAGLLATYHHG
jgi:hypothetical protein